MRGRVYRLKLHKLADRVVELNRAGAALARQVAGDQVLVAGSMGPTGELIEPLGTLSMDAARAAFAEMRRVTRRGGRVACLDASRPDSRVVRLAPRAIIRHVLAFLGGLITGDYEAYRYLHASAIAFHSREQLAAIMQEAGWTVESVRPLCFGAAAIHVGVKEG